MMKIRTPYKPRANPPIPLFVPLETFGIPIVFNSRAKILCSAAGIWPFKRIVVSADWWLLPDREKQAVLLHEVGHCRFWHMEKRILSIPILLISLDFAKAMAHRQELQADTLAAKYGFGVELMRVIHSFGEKESLFYPITKLRLDHLALQIEGNCRVSN